jgi:hypothetical protein
MEDPPDGPQGSTWLLRRIDRRQVYGHPAGPLVLKGLELGALCRLAVGVSGETVGAFEFAGAVNVLPARLGN